jgi:UDP-N-acetylglucosamine 2-epimerase
MRDTTERPEAVETGTATLVGTETERLCAEVTRRLAGGTAEDLPRPETPYGNGRAAEKIVAGCRAFLAEICGRGTRGSAA